MKAKTLRYCRICSNVTCNVTNVCADCRNVEKAANANRPTGYGVPAKSTTKEPWMKQAKAQAASDSKQHTEDCLDANDDTSPLKGECICPTTAAQRSPTRTTVVTFDGFGINDTDLCASRIATFTDYGKADPTLGPRIVRAVNAHEELLKELHRVAQDMNTLVDNAAHWNRAQMREVIFAIQSNVTNAIVKAEGK